MLFPEIDLKFLSAINIVGNYQTIYVASSQASKLH